MRIDTIKPTEIIRNADISSASPIGPSKADFGKLLSEALGSVNHLQKDAETASINLAAGKIQDISQVTIATEKASVALQLTMQVRNKVIDAYQEIMRMQV